MSLSKLYNLKIKKEQTKKDDSDENIDDVYVKLRKLSITPELAKQWADSGCGKPC